MEADLTYPRVSKFIARHISRRLAIRLEQVAVLNLYASYLQDRNEDGFDGFDGFERRPYTYKDWIDWLASDMRDAYQTGHTWQYGDL